MQQYGQPRGYPSNESVHSRHIFGIDMTGGIYPPPPPPSAAASNDGEVPFREQTPISIISESQEQVNSTATKSKEELL